MFYALAIILFLFLVSFTLFLIFLRKMNLKTFKKFCEKKVKRFARRNKLLAIENLNILNYQRNKLDIDHVIFGKKAMTMLTVTDHFLKEGRLTSEQRQTGLRNMIDSAIDVAERYAE